MIVRREPGALLLVTQPDHAALAARIMRSWRALDVSPRRADILLAVELHDNGWKEVDAAPIVDPATGQILDFIAIPEPVRQGVWPRAVDRLASSPYAAALVAQHALHVYSRFSDEPSWARFFAEMAQLRERHLAASGHDLDTLFDDYRFVRAGDMASLVFCNGWAEPQDDGFGSRFSLDGTRLSVRPDPFGGDQVPLTIEARALPDRAFESADAAKRAMREAPPRTMAGTAIGAP